MKKTSDIIIDDILKLKHFIDLQLPDTHIISKMKFTISVVAGPSPV